MNFRKIVLLMVLLPSLAFGISDEEKQRGCNELAAKVLPVQRKVALERCLEFASNECDRIERQFYESCLENSHSDNAIKYDINRGNARSCEAAIMKRETHRALCEGLKKECRESKVAMGGSGVEGTCAIYRDENDKRLCVEIDRQAARIIAAEKSERELCEPLMAKQRPKPAVVPPLPPASPGAVVAPPPPQKH